MDENDMSRIEETISKIDRLRTQADADRPWFIARTPTTDGLSLIEDGRFDGMFPVRGETHEIALIVEMHNAWPDIREALLDAEAHGSVSAQRVANLLWGRKPP